MRRLVPAIVSIRMAMAVGARRERLAVLILALSAFAVVLISRPAIPQDVAYHHMADTRPVLGIANGLNVVSNVPFALVGIVGLAGVLRSRAGVEGEEGSTSLRGPHVAVFGGTALTAVGSAYYHLAPGSARLVWDRLPMSLVCAGLVTVVLAECVDLRWARRLFLPILASAVASVGYWRWSELQGVGDLRPYALVQYGALLAIAMMLALFRGRVRRERYLIVGLIAYACAKGFEMADAPFFALTAHAVSGHSLKHLMAAAGLACIAAMVHSPSRSGAALQPRA
jgi:hypothetical protein